MLSLGSHQTIALCSFSNSIRGRRRRREQWQWGGWRPSWRMTLRTTDSLREATRRTMRTSCRGPCPHALQLRLNIHFFPSERCSHCSTATINKWTENLLFYKHQTWWIRFSEMENNLFFGVVLRSIWILKFTS